MREENNAFWAKNVNVVTQIRVPYFTTDGQHSYYVIIRLENQNESCYSYEIYFSLKNEILLDANRIPRVMYRGHQFRAHFFTGLVLRHIHSIEAYVGLRQSFFLLPLGHQRHRYLRVQLLESARRHPRGADPEGKQFSPVP